jgi:hypothetical protein
MESRLLSLEWPEKLRVGDGDWVRLSLTMDEQGQVTPTLLNPEHAASSASLAIPDLYATHNVIAEARLDLAGMQVAPAEPMLEPLAPGQAVTFVWSVHAGEAGTYRGTVWLNLRFIPRDGSAEQRYPLSAQLVQIRAVNLLGMDGATSRVAGGVGAVLGSVLSLENLLPWAWRRLRRKKEI